MPAGGFGVGQSSGAFARAVSGLLIVLGVLLLATAAAFGWARWQGRSSVPLDDQLPYLLGVDAGDASPDGTDATAAQSDQGGPDTGGSRSNSDAQAESAIDSATQSGSLPAPGTAPEVDPGRVVVYVSGAVVAPGVVELAGDARVHHAVDAAGGPNGSADLERVNLAALLMDGERIHVPEVGDDQAPELVAPSRQIDTAPSADTPGIDAARLVDINNASVTELEQLPGIGPSIARSILDLRTARGPYASVDELLLVDGIGPNKLETLRPHAFVRAG